MLHGLLKRRLMMATGLYLLFAVIHSVLTSAHMKVWSRELVGERYGNALYRLSYNIIALGSLFGIIRAFLRVPDKQWYHVVAPWSWVLRMGQGGGVLLGILAVLAGGIGEFTGVRPLGQFLCGAVPAPAQEGHGPHVERGGTISVQGPFRVTRHPANWGMAIMLLLNPRMSRNRVLFTLISCGYLLLGSLHEEHRARAAYGSAYDTYRQQVPFLFPGPSWLRGANGARTRRSLSLTFN